MQNRIEGIVFFAVCLLTLLLCRSVRAGDVQSREEYWGVATDEHGKIVYREKHTALYADGRILKSLTSYLDPEGKEIAVMESNYARSVALPTYVFKDYKRDYEEGVRFRDGKYYIFNRDSEHGEKEKALGDTTDVYSCQGWHYYVVDNLEDLEKDQSFTLKLIFPKKLKTYPFKIEKVGSSDKTMDVKVRFANRAISWLVPHLDLVYNKKDRKLIEFRGVSNIFDANDDLQDVRITYYEQE
jgi:hypothetical protein